MHHYCREGHILISGANIFLFKWGNCSFNDIFTQNLSIFVPPQLHSFLWEFNIDIRVLSVAKLERCDLYIFPLLDDVHIE